MGKARIFSDGTKEVNYQKEFNDEIYASATQQNSYNLGSVHFSDQSGIGNFQQAGTDQRKVDLNGALFQGNIGFILQSGFVDFDTNELNLLVDQSNNPLPRVSTDRSVIISGLNTTATLITILGAQRPGQRLTLYNTAGNVITLQHSASGANTILTPDGNNFVLQNDMVIDLYYDSINSQWRILSGVSGGSGGGGNSFPILYPKEDLTPAIAFNQTIDLSITTGNAKQIQFPAGDIGFQITGDPAITVGEDVYVMFIQDNVGGRSLSTVDSAIKNGSLMDALLDKNADAKTTFRLSTLDGGVSYHAILVDLSSASGGLLSTLTIDVSKDWEEFSITNLGGIDLFTTPTNVANPVTNASFMSFISDGAVARGQIGRSDFFSTSQGTTINIPGGDNFVVSEDATESLKIDFTANLLSTFELNASIEKTTTTPVVTLFRDQVGATDNVLGNIIFKGQTASGGDFTYSALASTIDSATLGLEESTITLSTTSRGTFGFNNLIINADSEQKLRYTSVSNTSSYLLPVFELVAQRASVLAAQPDIGQINFNADTDDGGGIGAIESFAQIIATQEDSDITNESGSLRFRVRDQSATVGALKTYLQFNDTNSEQIQALKNLDMDDNGIENISIAGFVDTGGVSHGSISGDSGATAIRLSIPDGDKFIISEVLSDIAQFWQAAGDVPELNMLEHRISDASSLDFADATTTDQVINRFSLGYNATSDYGIINIPTDDALWITEGSTSSPIAKLVGIPSGTYIWDTISGVSFADGSTAPAASGNLWRNGADIYAFTSNGVKNLADIGSGGGGEVPIWTEDHDADGYNFLLSQDGLSRILNDREPSVPAGEVWFQVSDGISSSNTIMVLDNGASEVRIQSPYNLNPSSSGTQTLGVDGDRWDAAWVDAYVDFDDSGTPATPGTGEGRIFWDNSTKSFHQVDDVGTNTDLSSASAGANQQLSNLSGTVSVNLDLIPNQAAGGNLGSTTATEEWFNLYTRKVEFPVASGGVSAANYGITRTALPSLSSNVPTGSLFSWAIQGTTQMDLTTDRLQLASVNLDMDGNNIINSGDISFNADNFDIGNSSIPLGQLFTREIVFPDLVSSLTGANREIISQTLGGANSIVMNLPTDEDFIITESADSTNFLLKIDTSANILNIGIGASLLGMNLNDKSMSFPSASSWTFTTTAGQDFVFSDGQSIIEISAINGVEYFTATGGNVGKILGIDSGTDIFQIDAANNVDFAISDNGGVFFQYATATGAMQFTGSAGMQMDTDYLDINDVTTEPATPGTGFARLFVFDAGGGDQSLRVKFDNGTVVTIAND